MSARRWAAILPRDELRMILQLLAEGVPFRSSEDLLDRLRGVPDRPTIVREDFEGTFNELEDERLIRWEPESGRYAVADPGRVAELRAALEGPPLVGARPWTILGACDTVPARGSSCCPRSCWQAPCW